MNFVAIDIETANPDLASICQIGAVHYRDGQLIDSWSTLVDPQDEFAGMNSSIHGINATTVEGAPTFFDLSKEITARLAGQVVATHTAFDRTALQSACARNGIDPPNATWLDTARVARRAWSQFLRKGYGLANLAKEFGIEFQHHDALEDARAAAEVLLHAIQQTGRPLEDWLSLTRVRKSSAREKIEREGDSNGPLFGEVAVFTGSLSIFRNEAADLAAAAGCQVASSVTKVTTLLVVGDQDIRLLAGHKKSSKHRKAEKLITAGQPIRVLQESDFHALVDLKD